MAAAVRRAITGAVMCSVIACSSGDPGGSGGALKITPDSVTVAIGSTAQLQAADVSGQPVAGVVWTTGDATRVTVSAAGVVAAVAAGRVVVTATAGGRQGTAIIRSAVAKNFSVDAQITQGTQSADGSIPMVLGGNAAVVNVTVRTSQAGSEPMQLVLRLFAASNGLIRSDTFRMTTALSTAPTFLTPSAQFLVAASQLAAIASWQVVRDPKGDIPDTDPTDDVYPRIGRATLAKMTVPALARISPPVL